MKSFKGLSVILFLFAILLTACDVIDNKNAQSNTNKPKVSSPPPPADDQNTDNAKRITLEEARAAWEKQKDGVIFIDTRGEAAYKMGHIKGALLLSDFLNRASSFPKDKTIIVYCT